MSASRATSGGVAASSQFDNHADWLDVLAAATLGVGGTVGAATVGSNVGGDEVSGTTGSPSGSPSSGIIVTHGLGWTPQIVFIQMRGNPAASGPYATYVSTVTSSSFIVFFRSLVNGSAAVSGQSVVFDWLAFKAI